MLIVYLWPTASWVAASVIAFMPLAHTLFIVVLATEFGRPAPRAACLAGACPTPKLILKNRIFKQIFIKEYEWIFSP